MLIDLFLAHSLIYSYKQGIDHALFGRWWRRRNRCRCFPTATPEHEPDRENTKQEETQERKDLLLEKETMEAQHCVNLARISGLFAPCLLVIACSLISLVLALDLRIVRLDTANLYRYQELAIPYFPVD